MRLTLTQAELSASASVAVAAHGAASADGTATRAIVATPAAPCTANQAPHGRFSFTCTTKAKSFTIAVQGQALYFTSVSAHGFKCRTQLAETKLVCKGQVTAGHAVTGRFGLSLPGTCVLAALDGAEGAIKLCSSGRAPTGGQLTAGGRYYSSSGNYTVDLTVAATGLYLDSFSFGASLSCNNRSLQGLPFELAPGSFGTRPEPPVPIYAGKFHYRLRQKTSVSYYDAAHSREVVVHGFATYVLKGVFTGNQAHGVFSGTFSSPTVRCTSATVPWNATAG